MMFKAIAKRKEGVPTHYNKSFLIIFRAFFSTQDLRFSQPILDNNSTTWFNIKMAVIDILFW